MMAEVQITSKRFINEQVCIGKATLTFVGGVCMHIEGEIGDAEARKLYSQPDLFEVGPPKPVTVNLPGAEALGGGAAQEPAPAPPDEAPDGEDEPEPPDAPDAPPAEPEAGGEPVPEPAPAAPAHAPRASASDDLNMLTIPELRVKLNALGVAHDARMKKADLVGLARKAINEAAAQIPDVPGAKPRPDPELLRPEGDEDFGRSLPRARRG
jgi:pyruvate/2-oxoglutarate dehydrogenase complex dihydrolipoamide acyltransferase (E2) component